tara:strand:+ start:1747 stop:2433 length:687 start_codon:yes stop_codon:yes gene_type:complete
MSILTNPSLSPPIICDACEKEYFDFNSDGSKNFTQIYTHQNFDYCIDCLPQNTNNFQKISVYERIGKANLTTGNIENILKNFNFNFNFNNNDEIIPQAMNSDSNLYKLALRFYKDINDLNNDEFEELKQLLLDSKLEHFNNNTTKTFKLGPDHIMKNHMISLNVVNAIVICPYRGQGSSDFKISISRDGDVGAFDTYGLISNKLIPDEIMDSLDYIDDLNLEPDNLLN